MCTDAYRNVDNEDNCCQRHSTKFIVLVLVLVSIVLFIEAIVIVAIDVQLGGLIAGTHYDNCHRESTSCPISSSGNNIWPKCETGFMTVNRTVSYEPYFW